MIQKWSRALQVNVGRIEVINCYLNYERKIKDLIIFLKAVYNSEI